MKKKSPLVPATWSANGPSTMGQPGTSHQRGGGVGIMEEPSTVVRKGAKKLKNVKVDPLKLEETPFTDGAFRRDQRRIDETLAD